MIVAICLSTNDGILPTSTQARTFSAWPARRRPVIVQHRKTVENDGFGATRLPTPRRRESSAAETQFVPDGCRYIFVKSCFCLQNQDFRHQAAMASGTWFAACVPVIARHAARPDIALKVRTFWPPLQRMPARRWCTLLAASTTPEPIG